MGKYLDRKHDRDRGQNENVERYVKAKWRDIATPTVTKVAGIFVFEFHSAADMMAILEQPTGFVFDKPLLLKQYEAGMVLWKNLFKSCPVWVRFPRLGLQLWTPKILGKLASKIVKPLLADTHTIRKTKLGAPRLLNYSQQKSRPQYQFSSRT